MSDSWVVQNLNNALNTWNGKLAEVWQLLLMSPQSFKGGGIWKVILQINGAVQAIGLALLVLFFLVGVVKTTASLTEIKRPEHALKLFLRFCIAKGVVTYGLELMLALFNIAQGVMSTMMKASGVAKIGKATLPDKMVSAIEKCGFFESIQSYHRDEKITPEYAHALAQEFAAKAGLFRGFEVLIATHTDREHIHTHFIVNSVNAETGRKIHMDASNLKDLRDLSDDICREHGLTVTEPGKSFSGEKKPAVTASKKGTYQVLQKGMQGEADSYVYRIFLAVINAISSSRSKEQFIDLLKQKKIDVTWTARKYITFTDLVRQMEGESKCKIRNSKLEKYFHTDFSKEALLRQFEMNDRIFKEKENHEWPVQLTAEDCRIIYEHIRYAFWAMEEDEIYSFPSFRLTKMVIKYTQPSPAIKEKIKTYIDQSEIMQRKREAGMLLPVTAVVKPGPKKSKHENEFLTELKKEMGIDMPQQRARQRDWGFELD